MYYSLLRKLLFRLDPEKAHHYTLRALSLASRLGIKQTIPVSSDLTTEIMGLTFSHPVGLAAGLDKNGDYLDALSHLGFSFIEIGTVTPRPQTGNPPPRLFRLPHYQAIINRMGFNNKGLDYLVEKLKHASYRGILGINIGKNHDTPIEKSIEDYVLGFRRVSAYASYVTLNISSPNTKQLRDLQHGDLLENLLHTLKKEQSLIHQLHDHYVPLVVKIAPDLSTEEIECIADVLLRKKIDGVIATNTTVSREGLDKTQENVVDEVGGLSGKPLCDRSTAVIKKLQTLLRGQIPIIASGGIMDVISAKEKLAAGASLIQLYTGLIYQGPGLISDICHAKRII